MFDFPLCPDLEGRDIGGFLLTPQPEGGGYYYYHYLTESLYALQWDLTDLTVAGAHESPEGRGQGRTQ